MDIETIKKNINEVLSPNNNGQMSINGYILVKVTPTDQNLRLMVSDNLAEEIIEKLPSEYRDHLITLKQNEGWLRNAYLPVFDEETQAQWDNDLTDYDNAKAQWCRRYGSE